MVTGVNSALVNYLSSLTSDSAAASGGATTNTAAGAQASGKITPMSQAALQRAASLGKSASAVHDLDAGQKTLATDLRAAMAKAGVKLTGPVEFSITSAGAVQIKASDADKAATQAFLKADTSQPSLASRIVNQAKDALKVSATIQQSAAISQAAKLAKSSGGVISLYTSLMSQSGATNVVFSLSSASSSLTYPGSLAANA